MREIQLAAPLSLPCLHLYPLTDFNPSSLLNEQEQELLKEQIFWSLGSRKFAPSSWDYPFVAISRARTGPVSIPSPALAH